MFPPSRDKRRKTVGHNISPKASEPNYIQIAVPSDDDLDRFASFVGELAEKLGLKPWRPRDSESSALNYELRPVYSREKTVA